jgi:aldose sugar dehydrogenase
VRARLAWALVALCAALATTPAPTDIAAAGAAPSLEGRKVAGGLEQPVGFTFDPRGRIWYVEKASGEVRILNVDRDTDRLFYRFSGVSSRGERGALGIALHPDFPATPFVYVYVTRRAGDRPLRNQIVRLRDDEGRGVHPSVLFRSPRPTAANHNGGRILFGPDGMLYAVVGDGGSDPATAQDLADVRGKILRMTPRGAPAPNNPFASLVFAYGIRNSFGFDFDPQSGELWETENGPECNDELNRVLSGENHAWGAQAACGSAAAPLDTNQDGPSPRILPLVWFTPTIAPTGMAFCDACGLGPAADGTFFFGTSKTGEIRQATLNDTRDGVSSVVSVLSDPGRVVSLETAPDGRIYFSDLAGRIFRLVRA